MSALAGTVKTKAVTLSQLALGLGDGGAGGRAVPSWRVAGLIELTDHQLVELAQFAPYRRMIQDSGASEPVAEAGDLGRGGSGIGVGARLDGA